jgi:hypothetical protein
MERVVRYGVFTPSGIQAVSRRQHCYPLKMSKGSILRTLRTPT